MSLTTSKIVLSTPSRRKYSTGAERRLAYIRSARSNLVRARLAMRAHPNRDVRRVEGQSGTTQGQVVPLPFVEE